MALTPLAAQQRAIEAAMGPVLVVAGPGAGKTFCLIGRLEHLVPRRAAGALAVARGGRAEQSPRGTIHAFCLALLREYAEAAGLRKGFGVADDDYQRVILSRLRVPADRRGQLLTLFGRHRFQGYRLTPGDIRLFHEYTSWLAHRHMEVRRA